MSAILITVVILLYSFQSLFCKIYTNRYPGKPELASPVFCTLESAFIFLFTWIWHGFHFKADLTTVFFGISNAVVLWGFNTFLIKASNKGSYAFMNVMMLFGGILVPIIYNTIAIEEKLKLYQLIAIALMLLACLLMNLKEIQMKGTPMSYYFFCVLLFVCNGLYGVLLKIQADYNSEQSGEMIMLTFGIMGIIAFVQLMIKEKKKIIDAFRMGRETVLPLAMCLLSASLAINALVLILPLINASIFYTVECGGVLLLSSFYAVFIFREKLSVLGIIGVVLALISITALSI